MFADNIMHYDYDAEKFKCSPLNWARGPTWVRGCNPALANMFRASRYHFYHLHQHFITGLHFDGWASGVPHHIAGASALAAQDAPSIQARLVHGITCINLFKAHVSTQDICDAVPARPGV